MLKFTSFDYGWGSAPDQTVEAHNVPPDPYLDLKHPTSKVREGTGIEERMGRKEDGGRKEGKGKEKEGRRREGMRGWKRGNGKERGLPPYFVQGPLAL